ncbi:Aste57867_3509 [Aphanomyces stellatus]|uniref:Aste57867_3509 protein n=1 Tax=Aphanomyces stellatus TaxID=120398 RepID=A0A485KDR8_9STRA|nr:hypothetical protein As57867_003498 [Aphanomyces stellatus]VFT80672.1 Aste57867_3509 [Aphanomyces stellatus]
MLLRSLHRRTAIALPHLLLGTRSFATHVPKYITTRIDDEVDLRVSPTSKHHIPITFSKFFCHTATMHSAAPALHYKANGHWHSYSWQEYHDLSVRFAKSLIHVGNAPFDTVAISGFNAPQWFISYVGTSLSGGVSTGMYTTNMADACQYVTAHAKARVVVVDNLAQVEKFASIADSLPHLQAIVAWDIVDDGVALPPCRVPIYTFDAFLALGADTPAAAVDARVDQQRPGHCHTLVYTSGTTGTPKGVMLSHDNMTYSVNAVTEAWEPGFLNDTDRIVSYLPLSHIAGLICDVGLQVKSGGSVYFAQPDAMKGSLVTTLREVRPTFFLAVPRVYEKFMEKIVETMAQSKGLRKKLAAWAMSVGLQKTLNHQHGHSKRTPATHRLAKRLVLDKVKAAIGLDQTKALYFGAAPLSPEVFSFFASLDMPIIAKFGMSETNAMGFMSLPRKWKAHSMGAPLPSMEVKIAPGSSELLFRGRAVMMGYLNADAQTAETFDADGFLKTGDCATIDANGFAYLTGRMKELLKTAGGEYVAPVHLENVLKEAMPILSTAVVIGDAKKFLTALFTLRVDHDQNGVPLDTLDAFVLRTLTEIGSTATTVREAQACPLVQAHLQAGLEKANARAISRAQKVQKFTLLDKDFSVSGGEFTATLKLKRKVITDKYAAAIDTMYK